MTKETDNVSYFRKSYQQSPLLTSGGPISIFIIKEYMYLKSFTPIVNMSNNVYIVDYGIGECVYTYTKVGKRIKQDVLQLIKTDMWKVITVINDESPLSEGDFKDLNMEIRNHSLRYVTDYINSQRGHLQ